MKLILDRELAELERIVASREAWFARHGLSTALAYKVDLATEELFVNMLCHSNSTIQQISLEMTLSEGVIQVSLTDHGVDTPFDPATVAPVDTSRPLSEREVGGLGLHLVRSLVGPLHYQYHNWNSTFSFSVTTESIHHV
ncbi:MAG: ATP-binding protein [Parahaliea sp.]